MDKPAGNCANVLLKPRRCCGIGTYEHTVPMPISGRVRGVDYCVSDIVAALNAANITTLESCCGHGEIEGSIILEDGRELVIRQFRPNGELRKIKS